MSSTEEWLHSGEYLPEFMRDFHDQKDLFKALQEVVERRNEKDGLSYTKDLNWVTAHVYTIDIFLWVLARHGWTLQRSRKRVPFSDICQFTAQATARWRAAAARALGLTPIAPASDDVGSVYPTRDVK